jgi:hypothetical protein
MMSHHLWLTDARWCVWNPLPQEPWQTAPRSLTCVERHYLPIAIACDGAMRPARMAPPKTLYNRWKRWGDKSIFVRMREGLASEAAFPKSVMIDATDLKAHHTATSLWDKMWGPTIREAA